MQSTQLRSSTSEFRLSAIDSDYYRKGRFQDTEESHQKTLAQQVQSATQPEQRQAINKLLNALLNSGKLRGRGQYHTDIYDDAVNRTLCWIALHIAQFNPEKGRFLAWVNYRLDMMLRKAQSETLEPLVRSQYQKVIRRKYQLTAIAVQVGKIGVRFWLTLIAKGIQIDSQIISFLMVLCQLSQLKKVNPTLADQIFLQLAKQFLSLSPLQQVDGESIIYENLAPPEKRPCLSEMMKEYIESDPDMLCQNHVRNCSKATLKAILMARLEDQSWQEIADYFGLTVASVKKSFSRQMKTVAPLIKQHIQSEF